MASERVIAQSVNLYELREHADSPNVLTIHCAVCGAQVGGGLHNIVHSIFWPVQQKQPLHCLPQPAAA